MSKKIRKKVVTRVSTESKAKKYLTSQISNILDHPEMKHRHIENVMMTVQCTDGHIHHMIPNDEQIAQDMIQDLLESEDYKIEEDDEDEEEIIEEVKEIIQEPIIFKNRQALGDILMFTAGVRDFHKEFPDWPMSVSSTAMNIWNNNPYIDRSLNEQNAKVIEIGPSWLTNASNRDDRHFANAFRISIEQKLDISFPQGPIKPDIWMSREEVEAPPLVEPPYWIIVAGEKGDWTAKTYPFNRWQEFIKNFPQVKFVQVGAKEHVHPDLNLPNVINFIGKTQSRDTGIRDLINLFYHAEGSIGLVSFQMHLAAAFDMPCIVLAGAREPARFTRYPRQQYLCTDGCLPCASRNACWHCDLDKTCQNRIEENGKRYPKCVDIIKTEDVIRAFQQYYEGERLSFTEIRKPTLPNPISKSIDTVKIIREHKEKIAAIVSDEQKPWNDKVKKWSFEWGGGSVTDRDWMFILGVIRNYNIKSVLEFGTGLSTLLFNDLGMKIVTFETNVNWITKVQEINSMCDIREWDGKKVNLEEFTEFDLAFVDGPPGGSSREFSTKIASENAKIIIVHDAGREYEKQWQEKYIKNDFNFISGGGHRCHLWIKKTFFDKPEKEEIILSHKVSELESVLPELKEENYLHVPECLSPKLEVKESKLLKMFFQGRGEGGAEKSTTWIANRFIEMGWRVQYISNNEHPSGTFRKEGSDKVNFTNDLDEISKPCDLLVLYTNDYIWEFGKELVVNKFSNLQALRKVMCINFRLGKIGSLKWTQDWDQYLFLNSSLEQSFISTYMKSKGESFYALKTKSMPPPTDLTEYFMKSPDYGGKLRLIRHSSQGDTKYPKNFNDMLDNIIEEIPNIEIHLMPAPSFLDYPRFQGKVIPHRKNDPPIPEYLSTFGNVFWYKLPDGYEDQGPKVIMESMAVGIPVIADNHSGAKDRVVKETGILCNNFQEHIQAMKYFVSEHAREMFGKAAKEHAKKEFIPERWITEILG